MNFATDPFWAHKGSYAPEQLQAYENQVMIDRAAHERHRTEFDYAALAGSALLVGAAFQGRAGRKQAKARRAYSRDHQPQNYARRRMEYGIAVDRLESEISADIYRLEVESSTIQMQLPVATGKSYRHLKARLDALKAMVEDKRLARSSTLESLSMQYRDILEYDAAMEAL